jgi:tetratricopeptide (TPR) repeat protein
MGEQQSTLNVSTSSKKDIKTTTTASSDVIHKRRHVMANFLLIWVDARFDRSNEDCQYTLAKLQSVVNHVKTFTEPRLCIQYLHSIDNEKAFVISSGSLGEHLVPNIHPMPQVDTIYIFCKNKSQHEQWTKNWAKIKGVYTDIKPICEGLQLAIKQYNQDSIPMSFVSVNEGVSNQNLDQLEPSFMYTQIFKELLLTMAHDEKSIEDLVVYCRQNYVNNPRELNIIQEFERGYQSKSSIWWYTRECFTYHMLNRALRTLEANTIIKMGFFIRDLHHQIQQLHQQQVASYQGKSFIVYRGQGFSTSDFEKLQKTKGGLISFNNLLSTSMKRAVSLGFAKRALEKTNTVGVLFDMVIDPTVLLTPFAAIREVSCFNTEEEILFSMHTIFRIGEINLMPDHNKIYQVKLKLTSDDDQQLRTLTEHIRQETNGETNWDRLGKLLLKIGQFDNAEALYKLLLDQTSDENEKGLYYNNCGVAKYHQGDVEEAIGYYEKGLEIYQKTHSPNHLWLATSYSNLGNVYNDKKEFSKALSLYEQALEIRQKTLPENHPSLAILYNGIVSTYQNMGDYSQALSFSYKALEIREKTLPSNHPDLAESYNNLAGVYHNKGEFSKALSFQEKALEIQVKVLPPNHPYLAASYNNMGALHKKLGNYFEALSFYEKAVKISQELSPSNHPNLASLYINISLVYNNTGDYSKALSFQEKAIAIQQKTLPSNDSDLAESYNNIAGVYQNMKNYSKALSYFQHALQIWQNASPPNHPRIQNVRQNIENVKKEIVK